MHIHGRGASSLDRRGPGIFISHRAACSAVLTGSWMPSCFLHHGPGDRSDAQNFLREASQALSAFKLETCPGCKCLLPRNSVFFQRLQIAFIFTSACKVQGKEMDWPRAGAKPSPTQGAGQLLSPPGTMALPKAIACHNSPALRPWVNICARCLFELLQPPYLLWNTPRAN